MLLHTLLLFPFFSLLKLCRLLNLALQKRRRETIGYFPCLLLSLSIYAYSIKAAKNTAFSVSFSFKCTFKSPFPQDGARGLEGPGEGPFLTSNFVRLLEEAATDLES